MTSEDSIKLTLTDAGVKRLARALNLTPQKLREAAIRQGFDVEPIEDPVIIPATAGYYIPRVAPRNVEPEELVGYRLFKRDRDGQWVELGNETDPTRFLGGDDQEFSDWIEQYKLWLPLRPLGVF